ncbi:MAG: hypothetical protein P8Y18_05590 [Candidatus Bathyarchaeota archaeon]
MKKYIKIGIIFVLVVAMAILADNLVTQTAPSPPPSIFEPRPVPDDRFDFDRNSFIGDIELFYKVKTMLSTINATLLVVLIGTYIDMYRKLRSEFTIGLIVFSLTLLLYALSSNPLLQWIFGFRAFGLGPFAMLPDLFTTLALVVLSYLTMK